MQGKMAKERKSGIPPTFATIRTNEPSETKWIPKMLPYSYILCGGNIQRHSLVRLATLAA